MEVLVKAGLGCAVLGSLIGLIGVFEPDKVNPMGGVALAVAAVAFVQAASLLLALKSAAASKRQANADVSETT